MSGRGGAAVFAYGSLADPLSAAATLGREARSEWGDDVVRAVLAGWRRGFTAARDNLSCEKTFALDADGSLPCYVLGLDVRRTGEPADGVNGVVIPLREGELERLDARELRYDRVEVWAELRSEATIPSPVYLYAAKPAHLALEAPPGSVVLRSYVTAVELAFEHLGRGELDAFRASTDPPPTEPVEAHLVRDRIPPGNPRSW